MGLLQNDRFFQAKQKSLQEDFRRARAISKFVWIPHPVGWYPGMWYPEERIRQLWGLGESISMEVVNGANKTFRAYDEFDRKAVETWSRLLQDGKRVTALGGSDAHCPEDIGSVWTGVFAKECTDTAILQALNAGACFASESTLLDLRCGRTRMGGRLRRKPGGRLDLVFRAADAGGIASVRLICNEKVVKKVAGKNRSLVEGRYSVRLGKMPLYFRLETTASDDRRAFSSPLYCRPT